LFYYYLAWFCFLKKGGRKMTNRNNNRNQPHTGSSKADTEFGGELTQSKKARKKAAREAKK
jgi:hypothetical protein